LSHDFHLQHAQSTFYYRRKKQEERAPVDAVPSEDWERAPLPPLVDAGWASSWIETVQRAADRIKTLTDNAPSVAPLSTEPRVGVDLGVAIELLKKERYREALDLLGRLPPTSARDPDVILLRAVLLTHGGELEHARKVCSELVLVDEFSAGAHYLLALCAEGRSEWQNAVEEDQIAVYLDPGFAMPHLHLGLMARRSGDRETAHRELSRAALLLGMEDTSRLLLFGGGFSRDSLVALCKAELGRLGGGP
jgi:chemotaxis protein methyltransferase CheR